MILASRIRVNFDSGGSGPTIDTQPTDQDVETGQNASFTSAATTSGGPLTSQWYEAPSTLLTGETGDTLTINSVDINDNGRQFFNRYTDDNGSTDTNTVTLSVREVIEAGHYTYTGYAINFVYNPPPLVVDTGHYTYTGYEINFSMDGAPLLVEAGSYDYTGYDIGMELYVLAENVPSTGQDGPGFMYPELVFPDDNGKKVAYTITKLPSGGTFSPNLDSSFTFDGPDGYYDFEFTMTVDAVPRGGVHKRTMRIGVPP